MSEKTKLEYLDHAKDLLRRGVGLLDPEGGDFAILAGYLLLAVGIEKLIKHALAQRNELLVLKSIKSEDVIAGMQGQIGANKETVSLEQAFSRLSELLPKLRPQEPNVSDVSKDRNQLAHQSGWVSMPKIERRARVDVTTTIELVCVEALGLGPAKVLGEDVWERMIAFRKAYTDADALRVQERIAFLRRLQEQGQPLPCEEIEISKIHGVIETDCPVCDKTTAKIEISLDEVIDCGEGIVEAVYPYAGAVLCSSCGFSMTDPDDIEAVFEKDWLKEVLYDGPDRWEE